MCQGHQKSGEKLSNRICPDENLISSMKSKLFKKKTDEFIWKLLFYIIHKFTNPCPPFFI